MFGHTHSTKTADIEKNWVIVDAAGIQLEGNLSVPQNASGIVIFAHGSGSSRFSSRNRYVAQVLRDGGVGTLLIDFAVHATGAFAGYDISVREATTIEFQDGFPNLLGEQRGSQKLQGYLPAHPGMVRAAILRAK